MSGVRLFRLLLIAISVMSVSGCASKQTEINVSTLSDKEIPTPGSSRDFSLNVGDRILFTVDSVSLTTTAKTTLQRQAAWLKLHPQKNIVIEGHADERGTREYNLGLSAQRAEVTRSHLVSLGVATNRLRTLSYGKERPVAACETESCWSQNRRAVTLLNNIQPS
jgi:peptidoglycan-associated lipoprotein